MIGDWIHARVAELAYAVVLKTTVREELRVRVPSLAPILKLNQVNTVKFNLLNEMANDYSMSVKDVLVNIIWLYFFEKLSFIWLYLFEKLSFRGYNTNAVLISSNFLQYQNEYLPCRIALFVIGMQARMGLFSEWFDSLVTPPSMGH